MRDNRLPWSASRATPPPTAGGKAPSRRRRAEARRAATERRRARQGRSTTSAKGRSASTPTRKARKPTRRVAGARARHPASNTHPTRTPPSPRVRRRRIAIITVIAGLAVVGFLFAFVYPTSTFLRQRTEMSEAEQRIARIEAETERLEAENEQLLTDAEVERLAREQYGLVRPGETPYALVPSSPTTTPTTAPG